MIKGALFAVLLGFAHYASADPEVMQFSFDSISAIETVIAARPDAPKGKAKIDGRALLTNQLRAAVVQAHAYSSAIDQYKLYEHSQNLSIQQAVTVICAALDMLKINSEQGSALLEGALNDPKSAVEANGTLMKSVFELQQQNAKAWELYDSASGLLSYPLIDEDHLLNGRFHYLVITASEREGLKKKLKKDFGVEIARGFTPQTPNDVVPALLLWQFLGENWETSDQRR